MSGPTTSGPTTGGPAGPDGPGTAERLVIDEVSVRYDTDLVLDRFSLDVAPGEVVAVVGPSGSGKSTLLRAVAGLEPLAGGRVLLGARDLGSVPTHHRGLGLMFQDHGLFTHLDVAGNVGYGLGVSGVPEVERRRRVDRLIGLVGLDGLADRRVDQLSGGEAQRVALARALAPEPGLLMLDEPLGSLDRALREELTGELRRLLAELGQTALHVTHDQGEAFALGDRVAVIDRGRLVGVDRPARLWADPGTEFVARFLGHVNLWTVTIDGAGIVRVGDLMLGRVGRSERWPAAPGPIGVVLPATAVQLAGPARSSDETGEGVTVAATVVDVAFDRGRLRVEARLLTESGAGPPVAFDTAEDVEPGQTCRLRLDLDQLRPLGVSP